MGTSNSWAELNGKLQSTARAYADLPAQQVKDGCLIVKRSVSARMPSRLRGVGKRGAALTVRFDLRDAQGEESSGTVYVKGPAQLIENRTRPHRIPRERSGRQRRRRVIVIPGVGPRASANHPGTPGKQPWARGVQEALPLVKRVFENTSEVALRRAF